MERGLRQLIGAAAILGPGLHILSDILEWVGGGFSPAQLWYFSSTTLHALSEHIADYATLWHKLGALYTVHGGCAFR